MPSRGKKEATPKVEEQKNEFEQASAEAGSIVKKSPLLKKSNAFVELLGKTEQVDEVEERIVDVAGVDGQPDRKVPIVFTTFKQRDEEEIVGKQTVMEILYHYTTVEESSIKNYAMEVMEENGLSIMCFFKNE